MSETKELLFVYNADVGFFAQVTDFAHKILSPRTYACSLCKLTYGAFTIKQQWKEFLSRLPHKLIFLHRDEFYAQYPSMAKILLPAVFVLSKGKLNVFLSAAEINAADDLTQLQEKFVTKLNESQ